MKYLVKFHFPQHSYLQNAIAVIFLELQMNRISLNYSVTFFISHKIVSSAHHASQLHFLVPP